MKKLTLTPEDLDVLEIRPVLKKIPMPDEAATDIRKFAKTSLVGLITQKLKTDIFAGKYLPGQKLIVRELSEALGVSHTPVKDALNRLTAEGLVEDSPNRSMVVRSFTNDEMIETMGVRLMCEVFYAEEILRHAAADQTLVADLESLWQAMKHAVEDPDGIDYEKWVDYESNFHRRYMALCANAKLAGVYNALDANRFSYFAYLCNTSRPLRRETFTLNMAEHRAILDAIAAGDPRRFARAAAWHVVRACDDYAVDDTAKEKIEQIRRLAEPYMHEG